MNPGVFVYRCRPYGIDALAVARRHERIFIGHPTKLANAIPFDPNRMRSYFVDYGATPVDNRRRGTGAGRSADRARDIIPGSIVLIPRPNAGVVYCTVVKSAFRLYDKAKDFSDWLKDWKKARGTRRPEEPEAEAELAIEFAQAWDVGEFKSIPIPQIPGWIRKSFFGRNTYERVPEVVGRDPYVEMKAIISNQTMISREPTTDVGEVVKRLQNDLTPAAFEHLVVALLQLERPKEIWLHTGGSGDGGVDGFGARPDGSVTAVLQCKLQYNGKLKELADHWKVNESIERVVAILFGTTTTGQYEKITIWDAETIAELVIKHRNRLPQATSLRVVLD